MMKLINNILSSSISPSRARALLVGSRQDSGLNRIKKRVRIGILMDMLACESARMRSDVSFTVSPSDWQRLRAIAADPMEPTEDVWRAAYRPF